MLQGEDYYSVHRLFSQTADFGVDRFNAFLSGWAAVEILIRKSFATYEKTFLLAMANVGQPSSRERFLGRIREVMKDKYRLTDKFAAVTAVLFPTAADAEVQDDYTKFNRLKKLRDSIYHGEEFSERDLPLYELHSLLRKYVLAHLSN